MPGYAIQPDFQNDAESSRARIYTVISLIPEGQVATYGQIARLAGLQGQARQVGYALAALPEGSSVPWHRVINAKGEISPRSRCESVAWQRVLLERESVLFDASGRVLLGQFLWSP